MTANEIFAKLNGRYEDLSIEDLRQLSNEMAAQGLSPFKRSDIRQGFEAMGLDPDDYGVGY